MRKEGEGKREAESKEKWEEEGEERRRNYQFFSQTTGDHQKYFRP